jgi:hypothetical protein
MTNAVHEAITGVWERHENEEWRQEQSHYRGVGRWSDDTAWTNIGRGTIKRLHYLARFLNRDFPDAPVVLEWGPGGGSNLHGFRNAARRYFGVDISQQNLNEATRMIHAEADKSVEFNPVLLDGRPETVLDEIDEPVDLFLSTAVFQHFPNKEYGEHVLQVIRGACTAGAMGIIQIRFDNGNPKYKGIESVEEYHANHIRANSYSLDDFWTRCAKVGFQPQYISNINPANNYATFALLAV